MKVVTVIDGQTLHDIATNEYMDAKAVFIIMEDNPDIVTSLDVDLPYGTKLNIREDYQSARETVDLISIPVTTISIEVTSDGQTLEDLAIQCYGSVEGTFDLINDNPGLVESLNDSIPYGTIINVDITKVKDKDVLNYFKKKGIRINTGGPVEEGVGYWRIQKDNVVS